MLIPLLGAHPDRFTGDKRLLADKAYSHNSTREELRKRKIKHTIPERSNQISYRKSKGTTGGRPPAFDAKTYCHRNTVERGFNRLKQWRGVATRYDCAPRPTSAASPWPRSSSTTASAISRHALVNWPADGSLTRRKGLFWGIVVNDQLAAPSHPWVPARTIGRSHHLATKLQDTDLVEAIDGPRTTCDALGATAPAPGR